MAKKLVKTVQKAYKDYKRQEFPFRVGVPITFGQSEVFSLPKDKAITKISVRANLGTLNAGAWVANTFIKNLVLLVNGQITHNFISNVIPDAEPIGLKCNREHNKFMDKVSQTNEFYDIKLPAPLPVGISKEIRVDAANSLTDCSTGASSTTACSIDIVFEYISEPYNRPAVIERAQIQTIKIADSVYANEYLQSSGGYLNDIVMVAEDNSVFSDTAIDKIVITSGSVVLFSGTWTALQDKAKKQGASCAVGCAFLTLEKRAWDSNTLKIEIMQNSAKTDVNLHVMIRSFIA